MKQTYPLSHEAIGKLLDPPADSAEVYRLERSGLKKMKAALEKKRFDVRDLFQVEMRQARYFNVSEPE